jgi:hypothetical protein
MLWIRILVDVIQSQKCNNVKFLRVFYKYVATEYFLAFWFDYTIQSQLFVY